MRAMPPATGQRRRRSGVLLSITAVVLLVGSGTAWWLLRPTSGGGTPAPDHVSAERAPVVVEAVSPEPRSITRRVRTTGTLEADEQTTVAAKVSGRVVGIFRDLGDTVAPGTPLLRIDPTDYELARDERARAIEQALAKLGLTQLTEEGFSVDGLPSVERARLQAANAKGRYERGRQLAERTPPLISEQDFADLRTTWEVAESDQRLERLTAESTLAEARRLHSQLRIAEQQLADTLHVAPEASIAVASIGGIESPQGYEVAERMAAIGNFVQVGAPLFRLVDTDPIKLRAQIPERRIGAVRLGQRVSVRVEAYLEPFEGRVSRLSPTVDPATRTFQAEVTLPNADGRLRPGSFAVAMVDVGTEEVLTLPASTVITFAGVTKVVVVRDGKAQERVVEIGERHPEFVEVVRGIEQGDVVVRRPTSAISTGTPVTIRPGGEVGG